MQLLLCRLSTGRGTQPVVALMLVLQVLCQGGMVREDLAAGLAPQLPCSTRQSKLIYLLLRSQAQRLADLSKKRGLLLPQKGPNSAVVASGCLSR